MLYHYTGKTKVSLRLLFLLFFKVIILLRLLTLSVSIAEGSHKGMAFVASIMVIMTQND